MKRLMFMAVAALLGAPAANATIVSLGACNGSAGIVCEITSTPPTTVVANPNDDKLLAWNERQNVTLTSDLRVDRVFDPMASFVMSAGGGDYFIKAGTVVSSHYFQFDPDGSGSVETTLSLDSQVFAFITSDSNLSASDSILGLAGLTYPDFSNRGLEGGDATVFNGANVDIDWSANRPGDWTRLITAYSPTAAVPVPAASPLFATAFGLLGLLRRRA